jgi:predicted N-acyltransferase
MHAARRGGTLDLGVEADLASVDAAEWNALTGSADPFLEHEFLGALTASGAVGEGTGWEPFYLLARRGGRLAGAIAVFAKWDSYGEYIFDWAWADAYHRARISYYPKAVAAAPFTPVGGPRVLLAPGEGVETAHALIDRALEECAARGLSGLHFLFVPRDECEMLASRGFLPRLTYQFHWLNRGYSGFEDFLGDLRSSKRKHIVKERRRVAEQGLGIEVLEGADLRPEHADALWRFYIGTIEKKLSQAYLNRETFERLVADFRHRLVVVLALDGKRPVAGSLNVRKNGALYGRYWGCDREVPGLHFECCYYRPIEYAIATGVSVVEAGAQDEHKFLRGFVARPIYSAHWLAHAGGRAAIGRFLEAEREHTAELISRYNSISPVKAARAERP